MIKCSHSKLFICLFVSNFCFSLADVTLHLLHLNDFHARFQETSIYSGRCTTDDSKANNCYGGFARIHTKVKELRQKYPNTIFLAAGDYFQGTVWYTIHKWKPMAQFLNFIQQDVMALGNHEFDDGIDGLRPFLDAVNFPVLACNIDDSQEPSIRGKILPSVVLERAGQKIGIIGYVTTETRAIADPGNVVIKDEISSIRQEAKKLKRQGVNIIIGLGHVGFHKDLAVAEQIEDIDVVIGGHTNTFLFSGSDPSVEPSVGEYPTVVTQGSGKKVPVVQAYAFGKYLGDLEVTFDTQGNLLSWSGNPILLDGSVPQDPMVLEQLKPWKNKIQSIITEQIGKTFVFLDGNRLSCRMRECNLGNLETDAIVHQNAKYPDDTYWAKTSLAVINSGGIRASIDERASNGNITIEDVLTVAPFQNTIDIVELRGRHVKEMFEHSISKYDPTGLNPTGNFLQVSGFHVTYDVSKPSGSRVIRLMARCVSCRVPTMEDVKDNVVYKVAMPSFLANGGDYFTMVRDNKIRHHLTGLLDTDIFIQYIKLISPITHGTERRILFVDSSDPCHGKPVLSPSNKTMTSGPAIKKPPPGIPKPKIPGYLPPIGVQLPKTKEETPSHPKSTEAELDDLFDLLYDDEFEFDDLEDVFNPLGPLHNTKLMTAEEMVKEMMTRHDDMFFKNIQDRGTKKHTLNPSGPVSPIVPGPASPLLQVQFKSQVESREDTDDTNEDADSKQEELSVFVSSNTNRGYQNSDPDGQRRLYSTLFSQPRPLDPDSHESFEQHLYANFAAEARSKLQRIADRMRPRFSGHRSSRLTKSSVHSPSDDLSIEMDHDLSIEKDHDMSIEMDHHIDDEDVHSMENISPEDALK